MKKVVSLLVSLSMTFSLLCSAAYATEAKTTGPENEYVRNTARSVVTVADIDYLMGELNKALLEDDEELEAEVRAQLTASGAIPMTYAEVLALTGTAAEIATYASDVNIEFNTVYSDILVDGESVEIMRIYATPEKGSDMYHEGTANSSDTLNVKAGSVNALKTWGSFGVGYVPVVGTVVSVFEALADTITGFTQNNVIEQLDVQYVYRCIENTTFLYFWNENSNNWSHIGSCSRLGTRVIEIIDEIEVENFAALPGGYTVTYEDDIYATNYNNAGYCYDYWWYGGPCFEQQARTFSISGAAGDDDEVAVINMVRPYDPGMCR